MGDVVAINFEKAAKIGTGIRTSKSVSTKHRIFHRYEGTNLVGEGTHVVGRGNRWALAAIETFSDERLAGFDAAVLMEVIEHIEPSRLSALEDSIFAGAAPSTVIVTTPNSEYNHLYPALAHGGMRNDDHRFEWTRAGFTQWAEGVAERHGYGVEYRPVGETSVSSGAPTQMAIFRKAGA